MSIRGCIESGETVPGSVCNVYVPHCVLVNGVLICFCSSGFYTSIDSDEWWWEGLECIKQWTERDREQGWTQRERPRQCNSKHTHAVTHTESKTHSHTHWQLNTHTHTHTHTSDTCQLFQLCFEEICVCVCVCVCVREREREWVCVCAPSCLFISHVCAFWRLKRHSSENALH